MFITRYQFACGCPYRTMNRTCSSCVLDDPPSTMVICCTLKHQTYTLPQCCNHCVQLRAQRKARVSRIAPLKLNTAYAVATRNQPAPWYFGTNPEPFQHDYCLGWNEGKPSRFFIRREESWQAPGNVNLSQLRGVAAAFRQNGLEVPASLDRLIDHQLLQVLDPR